MTARKFCNLKGNCRPVGHDYSSGVWPAQLVDISTNGVGLVLSRRFEPGTPLIVEVHDDAGENLAMLLARVVRVAPGGQGGWHLGCSLIKPLEENYLRSLVQAPLAA
jgi:hypothetical protein